MKEVLRKAYVLTLVLGLLSIRGIAIPIDEGVSLEKLVSKGVKERDWRDPLPIGLDEIGNKKPTHALLFGMDYEGQIDEVASQSFSFTVGQTIVFQAEPAQGFYFSHWTVDGVKSSENTEFQYVMPDKSVQVIGNFVKLEVPKVSITAPLNNATITQGTSLTVNVIGSSQNGKITKVELYRNNLLVSTISGVLASYSFPQTSLEEGQYTYTAKLYDEKGGTALSEAVIVNVRANVAPTVSLTNPVNGASFTEGTDVRLEATASDSDGSISKVEFYRGSTLIGSSTTSPYSFNWSRPAAGTYSLTARAIDNQGAVANSAVATITVVRPNVAPTVSLTNPVNGASFTEGTDVRLEATASDSDGSVARVEFYRGSTLIGSSTTSPYVFNWSRPASGTYSLTARAIDNQGGVANSAVATITVVRPNVAPTVSLTNPVNRASFTEGMDVRLEATASDSDGSVARVEFYRGSTLIGSSTTSPYVFNWSRPAAGTYSLTARAIDNQGAVANSTAVNISVVPQAVEVDIPTVDLLTPVDDQTVVYQDPILLSVVFAGSSEMVKQVNYYANNIIVGSSSASPFSFDWKTAVPGQYLVKAEAIGGSPERKKQTREVKLTVVPKVSFEIVSPVANSELMAGGNLEIKIQLPNNSDKKVKRVEYFRGTEFLGSSSVLPYSFNWTNLPSGDHLLVARLVYEDNSTVMSQVVKITSVEQKQPTVTLTHTITKQINGNGSTDVSLQVAFKDLIGNIARVEYRVNGKLLTTVYSSPFTFNWKSVKQGAYQVEAIAVDGVGKRISSGVQTIQITKLSSSSKLIEEEFSIFVGPNPTSDYLNISSDAIQPDSEYELVLVSMSGDYNQVMKVRSSEKSISLDLTNLKIGVYVGHMYLSDGRAVRFKFLKK